VSNVRHPMAITAMAPTMAIPTALVAGMTTSDEWAAGTTGVRCCPTKNIPCCQLSVN
jgi:hypothetical protein